MTPPRREKGTGSIYWDAARKRYVGEIRTDDGKRRKVSAKTKTDARAALRQLAAKRDTGQVLDNRKVTVRDAVDTFIARELPNRTYNGRPLAPRTIESYLWAAQIVRDELGAVPLARLTVERVEAMYDRLAQRPERPLNVASLRKLASIFDRIVNFAVKRRMIATNVVALARITPAAAGTKKRESLSPDEARALLAALRHERNGAVFGLMLRLGLRPGEAAALHWTDFASDALNITRGVQLDHGRARVVDDLKTTGSKRTIAAPADVVAWLEDHRRDQIAERLAAGSWGDANLMFASPTGNVLDPKATRRQLANICKRAAVKIVRPNELRHSCASLLSDAGVSNELIADLLGHTTTRMVDQTYRHRLRPVVDVAARVSWAAGQ